VVSTNQDVTFFGPFSQNDVFIDILGAENGESKFHMSCSDDDFNSPDDCGKLAGNAKSTSGFINQWKLEGFIDAEGTVLDCTSDSGTDFPEQDSCVFTPEPANCDVLGKPTSLTFRYTGQGCSASDNTQDPRKATCSGDVNGLLDVTVVAGKNDLRKSYTVVPMVVAPDAEFTISATKFEADSRIEISNAGGTESNRIHLSCSQDLAVGDVFGSLELVGFNGASGGTDVLYGYTVTNNGDPLTGVTITDNLLGPVAGPFDLIENQSERFTKVGNVSVTTTNVATASGFLANTAECLATDQVTVEVEEPPQPPMTCRDIKKITALSMVWDGPSGVNIVTEGGQQFNNVQQGNQITFNTVGLGNDVDLSLSPGGDSRFHVSCSDQEMNGSEDCGSNQGDGKGNDSNLTNTWLFDGMTGEKGSFACMLPNTGVVDP
jgi:serine-aspartate repeat-containing protein C/D/E